MITLWMNGNTMVFHYQPQICVRKPHRPHCLCSDFQTTTASHWQSRAAQQTQPHNEWQTWPTFNKDTRFLQGIALNPAAPTPSGRFAMSNLSPRADQQRMRDTRCCYSALCAHSPRCHVPGPLAVTNEKHCLK